MGHFATSDEVEEMGSYGGLYQPLLTLQELQWKAGVKISNIATSWNPQLTMYLLKNKMLFLRHAIGVSTSHLFIAHSA